VKQLEVTEGLPFLKAVHSLGAEPTAILHNGRPVAVLLPVEGADLETVAMSLNAQFRAILERSAARQLAEGGVSAEEMRRRLAAEPSFPAKVKRNGRQRHLKGGVVAPRRKNA
jgi:hypothetical protein